MKNILGKTENLDFFNKNGKLVYGYRISSNGYSYEYTRNECGRVLTFKDSEGYSHEYTYDKYGYELTYKNSHGIKRGLVSEFTPEYTMEELVSKLGNFKIKK